MNVTTWNMQGSSASTEVKWRTGVLTLAQTPERWRPDVICLQECGGAPPSGTLLFSVPFLSPGGVATSVEVYLWGGTVSRPLAWVAFHQWDVLGNRVNLAVLTKQGPPAAGDVTLAWPAGAPAWRPVLGLRTGAQVVFSCHAISPGGADAPGLLAAAQGAAGALPWVVAGDFNRTPDGFAPAGSVVCPPNGPTYPTKKPESKYDYAIRSGAAAPPAGLVLSLLLSDHMPVAFIF
ncbi:endonuclease/exonuclease/phosphatase family protein [Pyxidicoccus caerfyrddinensis]|uniref:endonuclease/exonuclease/phosphatase family protein n=1 Tax=Pyxidicoccus caerfyrddinensis TaxID=2709663 RepID=UPI0013DD6497|nr:endonuclease/exonuclease/phosphatase family protein [Pyxidicoccus caerfyrddinensis]